MDERYRDDRPFQSARERGDANDPDHLPDYPGGYDETVRHGPPLDTDVATGDYRPGEYRLAGAGVRGYGEPTRWGSRGYDLYGGGYGAPGEGNLRGGAAPDAGPPADFGVRRGWGRMGGWTHGDTGMQRRSGPKGYKRSDDRIREDLCEHLMDIGDLDVSDVEVSVRDGCVVLEGTVPERGQKYEIEDIAAATLGVKDVENNLRVPRREVDTA